MELSEKFVQKYMRLAKHIADENNACYSRHLGVVLVRVYEDGSSRVVGSGYNGPPRGTPHCDSKEYLRDVFWPQLTNEEKCKSIVYTNTCVTVGNDEAFRNTFSESNDNCRKCPRKFIGAKSGERLDLCSCQHAERNAIYNSCEDLHGCWAFCFCGVPCQDCTGALINSGIKRVYCVEDNTYSHGGGKDYSFSSRWLFEKAGVELFCKSLDSYLK